MAKTTVLGVKLGQRMQTASQFQEILSKYGCNIKTRIGLHNVSNNVCSPDGVIIIEAIGEEDVVEALEKELKDIPHSDIQKMVFTISE